MYAHIKGNVEEIYADRVVIEAAGVGYELVCSKMTLKRLCEGKTAKLFVHFHLSQDSVALYGFFDAEERAMFRKLISVSRIGPKVALAVLSVLTPSDVALAVLTDNTAAFDGVVGMGKKTAARVILELKEISVLAANMFSQAETAAASAGGAANTAQDNGMRAEAVAALVALGYDGASAGRAVASVPDCDRVEDMIMQALRATTK